MTWKFLIALNVLTLLLLVACKDKEPERGIQIAYVDTSFHKAEIDDNPSGDTLKGKVLTPPPSTNNGGAGADTAHAEHIIAYAKNLLGVPYKYASANPMQGFDCSGFLYYVNSHFNIQVPRSSKDYMDFGKEISSKIAKPGDFILFTGTDSTERIPGHVGLITGYNNEKIEFIHSSSGKAMGVTISPLDNYYKSRFIKVIRILKNNDEG